MKMVHMNNNSKLRTDVPDLFFVQLGSFYVELCALGQTCEFQLYLIAFVTGIVAREQHYICTYHNFIHIKSSPQCPNTAKLYGSETSKYKD